MFHWAPLPVRTQQPTGLSDTVSPPPPPVARSQLAPALRAPVALINTFLYAAERNREASNEEAAGRNWEKISLIHFVYQRIYTLKIKLHV